MGNYFFISRIQWPEGLASDPTMTYQAMCFLYKHHEENASYDQLGFVLSCSNDNDRSVGYLHKVEMVTAPNFTRCNIKITHEVNPTLSNCNMIIRVHDKLIAACFNNGSFIPVKNFGYKKTFNSDVRAKLMYHDKPITSISANRSGTILACCSGDGEISLYQIEDEEIKFSSKKKLADHGIVDCAFVWRATDDEHEIIYATENGMVGLLDTKTLEASEIRLPVEISNLSTLCSVPDLSGCQIFFGTSDARLFRIDLNDLSKPNVDFQQLPGDRTVKCLRRILVKNKKGEDKAFVAYVNGTNEVRILDAETLRPDDKWIHERRTQNIQRGFTQVGNTIFTCGDETSIGAFSFSD